LCKSSVPGLQTRIAYYRAEIAGAIEQRNQAVGYASEDGVLFLDDDIVFEPECVSRLWQAFANDPTLGGVNALIINQQYVPPGTVSRALFRLLHGRHEDSYAGKCIGPACNLLPEDRDDLPAVVEVEWLNTTCTLYRRSVLPSPPFITEDVGKLRLPTFPVEDLAMSLRVHKNWKLANARTARIFHNSQPGVHKRNVASMSKMELLNRHYLMVGLLNRNEFQDYLKLALFETFGVVTSLVSAQGWKRLPAVLSGLTSGIGVLITTKYTPRA
jgi:glycosyltransferase involved in cell wall biosynthesis